MMIARRKFLHLAAGAGALPVVSDIGWAQPIRRGRCASSLVLPRAALKTLSRA